MALISFAFLFGQTKQIGAVTLNKITIDEVEVWEKPENTLLKLNKYWGISCDVLQLFWSEMI